MERRPASYRDVFAVGEFRAVWVAHLLSVAGDQLARVAVAVLVFDRTQSPAWTAVSYAVTFLPDLIGGSALSALADRFPRRTVMVAADLSRAALVAVMATPGIPLAAQIVLLFVVQLMAVPFTAARSAVTATVLEGDRLTVATGLISLTYQVGLVAGFGGGAAVVTAMGTRGALLVDAASFLISAGVLSLGITAHRPTASSATEPPTRRRHSLRAGLGLVGSDARLRALVALACVSGFYVVPEGLAVPYASQIGVGTPGVGWLLAANPIGTVAGVVLVNRLAPQRRLRLLGPLAVVTSAVLLPTWWAPGLAVTVVLWAVSGAASGHDAITSATFVRTAPEHARGQAVGLAVAALRAAQGVGVVVSGLLAQVWAPSTVIAVAAGGGVLAGTAAARAWSRADSPQSPATGRGEAGEAVSG